MDFYETTGRMPELGIGNSPQEIAMSRYTDINLYVDRKKSIISNKTDEVNKDKEELFESFDTDYYGDNWFFPEQTGRVVMGNMLEEGQLTRTLNHVPIYTANTEGETSRLKGNVGFGLIERAGTKFSEQFYTVNKDNIDEFDAGFTILDSSTIIPTEDSMAQLQNSANKFILEYEAGSKNAGEIKKELGEYNQGVNLLRQDLDELSLIQTSLLAQKKIAQG